MSIPGLAIGCIVAPMWALRAAGLYRFRCAWPPPSRARLRRLREFFGRA